MKKLAKKFFFFFLLPKANICPDQLEILRKYNLLSNKDTLKFLCKKIEPNCHNLICYLKFESAAISCDFVQNKFFFFLKFRLKNLLTDDIKKNYGIILVTFFTFVYKSISNNWIKLKKKVVNQEFMCYFLR